MDRFKFRVWKQDNWGYNFKNEFVKQKPHYEYFELNNNILFMKNNIIEQCTGFKDENGKLVYEEDIVKTNMDERCLVLWDEDDASFWLESIATGERSPFYCSVIHKVLGNIHENPELLGGM